MSTVIGNRPYRFVPSAYGKPLVTAGFEPLGVLQAIAMLLTQIRACAFGDWRHSVGKVAN